MAKDASPPKWGCMGSWHEKPTDTQVCPTCGSDFKCSPADRSMEMVLDAPNRPPRELED